MSWISNGLLNQGYSEPQGPQGSAPVAHFVFTYDHDTVPGSASQATQIARINDLIGWVESDYSIITGWFQTGLSGNGQIPIQIRISCVANDSQPVALSPGTFDPQTNYTTVQPITISPDPTDDASTLRYLVVVAVVQLMYQWVLNGFWDRNLNTVNSNGFACSWFAAAQFTVLAAIPPPATKYMMGNQWMSLNSRPDYVSALPASPGVPGPDAGCAILFFNYMSVQLGFTTAQIVSSGGQTLQDCFQSLAAVDDFIDIFQPFYQVLAANFPPGTSLPPAQQDNPFPLAILSFIFDQSSFGADQVTDAVNNKTAPGRIANCFWITVDGFSYTVLQGASEFGFAGAALSFMGQNLSFSPSANDPLSYSQFETYYPTTVSNT
jgi:hypothetical protein